MATFHASNAAKHFFLAERGEEKKKTEQLTRMVKSSAVPAVTDWSCRMVVVGESEHIGDLS